MSQFFMNKKANLVNEALEGLLSVDPGQNLARLDAGPDIRVVVRRDWDKSKVALISGGGSGHEPAHVGFVGKGLLTAAVCGDVFASPSVDAVLSAIINVTGEAGCLLIVKNYTGDRLNFGLAAEKARKLGYQVELVMVRDDISLPDNPQPRGIAGVAMIHKIVGHAAERGLALKEVTAIAQEAIDRVVSLGVAFSGCHIPGESQDNRVKPGSCELGMGIHGEPGVETLPVRQGQELVALMVQKLQKTVDREAPLAVLINNLGGFSALEMALLSREVLRSSFSKRIQLLIGPATTVSALDMKGFSLSVLPLNDNYEQALLAPVEAAGWPVARQPGKGMLMPQHRALPKYAFTASDNQQVSAVVTLICETLIKAEHELNALDALVGDGDTGSTFAAGARRVLEALNRCQLPLNQPEELMLTIAEHLTKAMGGSSGVLMSIMFNAAGQKLAQKQPLAQALEYGLGRMQFYGGAGVGDRTMVDALSPAFRQFAQGSSLRDMALAAHDGAEKTRLMKEAKAGRSSYLNSETLKGVMDPGARAVEMVFARLAEERIDEK